jgi:hypothetical protein
MEVNKDNKPSDKMREFLSKVDELCFEYGFEFQPTTEGYTGKYNKDGELDTFVCNNMYDDNDCIKLIRIDGDGGFNI